MNPPEAPAPRTICLVDDDASVLKALGRLLTSAGYIVQAFSEAAPFLVYISANRVDLVVLDVWMKQMTGLEVLARLCLVSPKTRYHYNRPRRCRREVDRDPGRSGRFFP
jgi:FixJ family two-component response regulator